MGWNEDVKKIVEFIPRFESMHREMIEQSSKVSNLHIELESLKESINHIKNTFKEAHKVQGNGDGIERESMATLDEKINSIKSNVEMSLKSFGTVEIAGLRKEMATISRELEVMKNGNFSHSLESLSSKCDEINELIIGTSKRIDNIEKDHGYDDSELREEIASKVSNVKNYIDSLNSKIKDELLNIEIPSEYDDSMLIDEINQLSKKLESIIGVNESNSRLSDLDTEKINGKIISIETDLMSMKKSIDSKHEKTDASRSISEMLDKINSIKSNVDMSLKSFGTVEIAGLRKEMSNISRELEVMKNGEH